MPAKPSIGLLFEFIIEKAPEVDLTRRALIYRSLAPVIGCSEKGARLNQLADECEAVERACQQLSLDFQRRAQS